jgi:outer membrane protein assembly factor BamB
MKRVMMNIQKMATLRFLRLAGGTICLSLAFCAAPRVPKVSPPAFGLPLEEEARLPIDGEIIGALRLQGVNLYFSTREGTVYGIDLKERKILWRFAAKAPAAVSPGVGEGFIVLADRQNRLYGLNPGGSLLWEVAFDGEISGDLISHAGRIYFTVGGVDLVAIDAATGRETWRYKNAEKIIGEPVFWRENIVIAKADAKLRIIQPSAKGGAVINLGTPLAGPLVIDRDWIYAGLEDGTFRRLDLKTGRLIWKVKIGGFLSAAPLLDKKRIYFPASNGVLYGLNKKNGELSWWRSLPARSPFSPVMGDDQILAASQSPLLAAFEKTSGKAAGTYDAGEEIAAGPLRFEERLIIGTFNPATAKGSLIFLKRRKAGESEPKNKQPPKEDKR